MTRHPLQCAPYILILIFLSYSEAGGSVAQAISDASGIDQIAVEPGSGHFVVEGGGEYEQKRIRVFYHRPEGFDRRSPVVMVIPGAGRNGDDYRDAWVEASEQHGALVLSPSYPERYYPDYWSYNLAGMTREVTLELGVVIDTKPERWTLDDVTAELDSTVGGHQLVGHSERGQLLYQLVLLNRAGMLKDVPIRGTGLKVSENPDDWIFADFDRIFERVKEELELETESYDLFGHSAGGQILHRLAIFHPDSRADRILAANSGWYTVPTFEHEFPYGLERTGMTEDRLAAAFARNLVVFLGEEDDEDETRGSVRRTPGADRQGTHRLARGVYFFRTARDIAEAMGVDFEWERVIVPGVGHDYERMSEAAASYLYEDGGG